MPFLPQYAAINIWDEVEDLIFYFKCCSGYYSLLIDDYVKPTYKGTLPTRHSHQDLLIHSHQDLLIPKCRTKLFQFSYFSYITKIWNALPESSRTLTSLNKFNSHYSNAILLLFVHTTMSLTLTPGSQSAANAACHLIFY